MTDPTPTSSTAVRAARCWTLHAAEGTVDVEVTARDDALLGAVLVALGHALGVPAPALWSGSTRLPLTLPLTAPQLSHGVVLGLDRPGPRDGFGGRSSALELHIVGGPDAGRTVPLGQGRHLLGRGAGATIQVADPDVSRRHVEVRVGGGTVTVTDLGSTNGSRLGDADLIRQPREWPAGVVLRLGSTAVTLAGPGGCAVAAEPAAAGRVRLRPPGRLVVPLPEVEVPFPHPPAAPPHRRLAWVAVALPAVGGLTLAWLLSTPTFLFFALLGPVAALGTWLSDRWSGRRSGRRATAAYAVDLLAAQDRLADALHADVRATEMAHPDPATLVTAARRRSSRLWARGGVDADALTIRCGTGPGSTRVSRLPVEGPPIREPHPHVPVTVDLRTGGGLSVVGPRERTCGVLRAVLTQLTALHAPGEVDLLLVADADRIGEWAWTRWLPHLDPRSVLVRPSRTSGPAAHAEQNALDAWLRDLVARRRATLAARPGPAGAGRPGNWLVAVVDGPLDRRSAATLRGACDTGILVLTSAETVEGLPVSLDAVLRLAGETGDVGTLSRQGLPDQTSITVDRMSSTVAAAYARDLAAVLPTVSAAALPRRVRLLDLPAAGLHLDDRGEMTGSWSRDRSSLLATLGRTSEGPLRIDLCRQGPHVLIAGTTGSGKSELLRTLIAGLALHHPPDRCSFLLVDYKGGAAFAEAVTLPHTVGLVTDLDHQATARALRSLTAELTRREAILADHRVTSIGELPDEVDLARLVIVVDEFATLTDELPSFVPGLIGIAQRGRSLGVHLVLATQRPSGVVSPEIRANCSLRICLRTTDEADSRDVLSTTQAAHLPVDLPGRAYVRTGGGEPTAVQVARVGCPSRPEEDTGPRVVRWSWPPAPAASPAAADDGPSDLARVAAAIVRHAGRIGVPPPHRPWRPPLPERLSATDLAADPTGARAAGPATGPGRRPAPERLRSPRLRIGLVDRPDTQTQEPLELDLDDGGGWLALGGARSGRTTLLRTVLTEAVRGLPPTALHVHVLDAGGGALAAEAAALPHTGTAIGGADALRTVRLVDRLTQEIAARRAGPRPGKDPLILLLVDGVEAISSLLDDSDPGRGSAHLLRLVRDGAAVGLTCLLTGERAVPGGRLASVAAHRLVLPLPDRADYAVAGIPARAVPAERPPGRALLGEDAWECQLALPGPPPAPWAVSATAATTSPPLRIPELLPDPAVPLGNHPAAAQVPAGLRSLPLPIGPAGDEGEIAAVDLLRTGGLLVAGPPGSGRTDALDAFARHLSANGSPVLRVGPAPRAVSDAAAGAQAWVGPADAAGLETWLRGLDGRPGVVIADDVGSPADVPVLGSLPPIGASTGIALVAAGSAGSLAGHYQGPVATLRRGRTGLLLCPGPGDADLLGIRLPRTPVPVRPGSGWLVSGGSAERVQVGRRRVPERSTTAAADRLPSAPAAENAAGLGARGG